MRVWAPHALSLHRAERANPGSHKEKFLALRATGYKQDRDCPSRKQFTGGRVGKKEKESGAKLWQGVNSVESNLIAQPDRDIIL